MNCRPDRVERRWTPLAAQMGYTSDDSQRAEILTAIDQMTWTALDSDAPWPSFLAGRATRAIVSAVIPRQRRKCGLGSARMAPRTSGRMLLGVQDRPGERLYLLDLDRGIAIHVLTEISSDEPPINRTGPRG